MKFNAEGSSTMVMLDQVSVPQAKCCNCSSDSSNCYLWGLSILCIYSARDCETLFPAEFKLVTSWSSFNIKLKGLFSKFNSSFGDYWLNPTFDGQAHLWMACQITWCYRSCLLLVTLLKGWGSRVYCCWYCITEYSLPQGTWALTLSFREGSLSDQAQPRTCG